MWIDRIVKGINTPQLINDSKTPSGRVHVGSLRGVLIHDAIFRTLKSKGIPANYLFGVDDYDPLDGLPADSRDLEGFMGRPLCTIPAPESSSADNLADHYIGEFLDLFAELGVEAEIYKMRDVYRQGRFNEAIDTILNQVATVRDIYAKVSGSMRSEKWHPFQVICEKCGKIGTTEVTGYDGREVEYHCRPTLVSWAEGCAFHGKVSPFDGNGKLVWKLEWVAKWATFGVTIEGAGKDHCSKGGSRDVGVAALAALFRKKPPRNVPYEFFLVQGAKMSSSKGIGVSAREMADLLPPDLLRYLMIGSDPKKAVNFSTSYQNLVKLFNDHDRILGAAMKGTPQPKEMVSLTQVASGDPYQPVNFQLLTSMLQMPHIHVRQEVEKRAPSPMSDQDWKHFEQREHSVRYWLETLATESDRFEVQKTMPPSVQALSETKKAFLRRVAARLEACSWEEQEIQSLVFDVARTTPIAQRDAFHAIYTAILDRDQGPKAGSLLSFLDKPFVQERFSSVEYSTQAFWSEASLEEEVFLAGMSEISAHKIRIQCAVNRVTDHASDDPIGFSGRGVFKVTLEDEKTSAKLVHAWQGENEDRDRVVEHLKSAAETLADTLRGMTALPVEVDHAVEILNETT